jgi:hypothetical protein
MAMPLLLALRCLVLLGVASALPAPSSNVSSSAGAFRQTLTCYERTNQYGQSFLATDYMPFISDRYMDNNIESCCFNGIWILYADENYNRNNYLAPNFWAYGENYCTNVDLTISNQASSLKFVGYKDDMYRDAITMYSQEYFIGEEEYSSGDNPYLNYDNRALSIIVTGYQPWTIYQSTNYQGRAACLYPGQNGFPGFYRTRDSLHSLAGDISSVAKGCRAETKLHPETLKSTGGTGASGFFPGAQADALIGDQ